MIILSRLLYNHSFADSWRIRGEMTREMPQFGTSRFEYAHSLGIHRCLEIYHHQLTAFCIIDNPVWILLSLFYKYPFSTNILQSSSIKLLLPIKPILAKKYRSLVEYRSLVQGCSMHKGTAYKGPLLLTCRCCCHLTVVFLLRLKFCFLSSY
jgi:hypothetical protein